MFNVLPPVLSWVLMTLYKRFCLARTGSDLRDGFRYRNPEICNQGGRPEGWKTGDSAMVFLNSSICKVIGFSIVCFSFFIFLKIMKFVCIFHFTFLL